MCCTAFKGVLILKQFIFYIMYCFFFVCFFFRSEKSSKTQKRIANIIEYLTFEVFRYTVRGLYENHKFIFTLLLALKIDLQGNKIEHNKFQILIKGKIGYLFLERFNCLLCWSVSLNINILLNKQTGGAALDLKTCPTKPFSWILDMVWLNLVELSKLGQFTNIINQVNISSMNYTF